MSLAVKRNLVAALLSLMVAWLPVHRWLVVRYEVNPWKFAGWAMYVAPPPVVEIEFLRTDGDRLSPLPFRETSPKHRDAVVKFLLRRGHAGNLVRPDGLVAEIFAVVPEADQLAIVVTHTVLDPETAMLVRKRFGYRYERSQSAPARSGE